MMGMALCVQAQDAPTRAGRLALIEGSVSLQPAGLTDWNAAPLNQPLTTGDALWSDGGSRAELDLGEARVRLDERSGVAILDLSDRAIQLRLDAGSVDIAVSDVADLDTFEIDAPGAAVSLLRPGEYRLTVDNAGSTSVAIRNGQAQVQSGEQQGLNLTTGQRGRFDTNGSYAITQAGPPDEFDLWCQQRQARWVEEQSVAQYVSSDAVGYADLNDYGQWQQQPDYGYVWFPPVASDWVPYSTGHWAWVGPWGWSWVDDAPWGFAPFHYGRWSRVGRRWGWVPAPPYGGAVYAPALVAWIGGPGTPGAPSLGGGTAVGWLPLAPGEVFLPAYRASPRYLQQVNLSNSRQLNAALIANAAANPGAPYRYANRDVPGALTVVPQVSFTAGQSVARHRTDPPPAWQTAAPTARVPAIIPERESVLGALTLNHVPTPPAAVANRSVISRHSPPMAVPSFERQRTAIAANAGRPLDATELQSLRGGAEPIRQVISGRTPAVPAPAPAPAPGQGPNVFQQRDREIEQERQAQLRQQQAQQLQQQQQQQRAQAQPRFQPGLEQQRLQEQERVQEQQRSQPPPPVHTETQPAAAPRTNPDLRRVPQQGSQPAPSSQH